MKKLLIWVVLLYPILWIIDFLSDSHLAKSYYEIILNYWKVGLVSLIAYWFYMKSKTFIYNELEDMRERQFFAEVQRYANTPFVPPILMMYLLNPPIAFSIYDMDNVNNPFYRTVINNFRDNIYRLVDYPDINPQERKHFLSIIGLKRMSLLVIYMGLSLGWLGYWLVVDPAALSNGWQLFTLPLIFIALLRSVYMLQAITSHLPSILDARMKRENVTEKLYTWPDLFPDKLMGQTLLRAYYAEKETRMRYEHMARNLVVPNTTDDYQNPYFPPFPYPSQEIPNWNEDMQNLVQEKLNERKGNSPKQARNNKVVQFKTR